MLQSKYLTQDGLTAWFKECCNLGFKYLFYNPDNGIYMLSEREPVFYNTTFMYCDGKKYPFSSYFSTLVAEDLLDGRNYIVIEDHIDVVDWSKVPVDTKVIVWERESGTKHCRYFARYENGKVYTWDMGATSWSSATKCVSGWSNAKLAEDTNE